MIPFAPGLFAQDFNIALLYFFAIGGLNVVGLMMAGWASFNKYSLLGALRAAAQAISYEIPLTLSVVGRRHPGRDDEPELDRRAAGRLASWTGTSGSSRWASLIFFIAAIAEANRTPLDMTEADQEIVAGFATEYSGMRFGFFFFAEYVNVFVVSAMTVVLFFGGWNAPFDWPFPVEVALDPASLGIGLLFLVALVPVAWGRSSWPCRSGSGPRGSPRSRRSRSASSSSTSSPSGPSWAGRSSASTGSSASSG